jgi:small-conductance mechanosensitive channel
LLFASVFIALVPWMAGLSASASAQGALEVVPAPDAEAVPSEAVPSEAETPAVRTPGGGRLGALATQTRAALQRTRPLVRPDRDVSGIARRLPRVAQGVESLAAPAQLARIPRMSQRELADLRQSWRRFGTRLDTWMTTLSEREALLDAALGELVGLRRAWRGVRDSTGASEGASVRHAQSLAALEQVRAAVDALDRERATVVGLEDRASALQFTVADVTDQIRAASSSARERVFLRDAPPLWQRLEPSSSRGASLAVQAAEGWAERTGQADVMLGEQGGALVGLFALLAALSLAFAVLGGWRGLRAPTLEDGVVDPVAARPFAAAGLVTLALAPLLADEAPVLLYDVFFFLGLLPLARVLGLLAPPAARGLLPWALAWLVGNHLEGMAFEGGGLRRALLLVECVAVLAVLVGWGRGVGRVGASAGERGLAFRAVRALAVASGVVAAAALGSNVLGFTGLAAVLMRGAGGSVHGALVLCGCATVAEAVIVRFARSPAGRWSRAIALHGELVQRRAIGLVRVGAALTWAWGTLEAFELSAALSEWANDVVSVEWRVGTLALSVGAVGLSLFLLAATVLLARIVRFVLEVDVLPRLALEPGIDGAISGLSRYVIVGIGLLLAMASLGIDASHIALVAGALGVGIGFGLQHLVANVIAGVVLMLERPVRLGDFIEVGALVGRVDRIGLRSSTVRGLDGAEVIVPNESLLSREVVNWTLSDRKRRVEVRVGVAYGTDLQRTLEVLRGVAAANSEVLRGQVLFEGFGDSSLDFVLQFWAPDFAEAVRLKSVVGLQVHDALAEAGIEIPFPQRDVRVISMPSPADPSGGQAIRP